MTSPRWIESHRFDSAAALLAYEQWWAKQLEVHHSATRILKLYGIGGSPGLRFIQHCPDESSLLQDPWPSSSAPVEIIPCPMQIKCFRCCHGKGGYTFRWYSPHWNDEYMRTRRPGAWAPGENERERPLAAEPYAGMAMDSFGVAIEDIMDGRAAVAGPSCGGGA